MQVLTVAHLKGGCGKTTTAAYLAHALKDAGQRVLVIDADPQGSLLRWSRRGAWSIPVRHMPSAHLDRDLAGLYTESFDWAVVDTGPYDMGVVEAAMRAADVILLPTSPGVMEIGQVKATCALAERAGGAHLVRILLNRPKASTRIKDAREAMAATGRTVLQAVIPLRVAVEDSAADTPDRTHGFHGYTGVALEILA